MDTELRTFWPHRQRAPGQERLGVRPGTADRPGQRGCCLHEGIDRHRITVLKRAQDNKLIDEAADLDWVRRVYYAPVGESLRSNADDADPDALAARIIDALLQGAGPRP